MRNVNMTNSTVVAVRRDASKVVVSLRYLRTLLGHALLGAGAREAIAAARGRIIAHFPEPHGSKQMWMQSSFTLCSTPCRSPGFAS